MRTILILFHDQYSLDNVECLEACICDLLYRADTPLRRCIHSEVDFNTMPFPSQDPVSGRICLHGEFPDIVYTVIRCHPDSRMIKGELRIKTSIQLFNRMLEDAFLTFLASFRHRTDLRRNLGSSIRFSALFTKDGDPTSIESHLVDSNSFVPIRSNTFHTPMVPPSCNKEP